MTSLEGLFCDVDDFCQVFYPEWEKQLLVSGERKRRRACQLSESEIMTILIHFHQSRYRDFKNYYLLYVRGFLKEAFPRRLSYSRFLEVMPRVLVPLCAYFTHCLGTPTGLAFVDSTSLRVCHNIRIPRHRVFAGVAARGKNSMGWFYGVKLHLVISHRAEIISAKLTPGNVDDRQPVPARMSGLAGKLYGDKGYLSKALGETLSESGVQFITGVRKNMSARTLALFDRIMLRKRFIIETVNEQLKHLSQIEHSRHRSVHGFLLNLLSGLIAYCKKPDKPSMDLSKDDFKLLAYAPV